MSKVIVAGAGNWGRNHVRTFFELGALAGVMDTNEQLLAEITEKFPGVTCFSSFEDVLDSSIGAVVIATPAHTHYSLAKAALKKGKDVFVEKPLTLSSEEAQELVTLAKAQNQILMVGHLLLYQSSIQAIKESIEAGEIGELYSLHQKRLKLGRARAVENVLWSFGVHDLAVFLYLTGSEPVAIQASGQCTLQQQIEDDVHVHLTFPNDVKAHLHTSWLWPKVCRELVVIGSKGMLVYDEQQQTVTLHRKGINTDLTNRDDGFDLIHQANEQPLTAECLHFLDCVQERSNPLSDGQNGLAVINILEQVTPLLEGGRSK